MVVNKSILDGSIDDQKLAYMALYNKQINNWIFGGLPFTVSKKRTLIGDIK